MNVATQTNFRFHSDPGHGWVQVPMAMLKELGIADKITGYSYLLGDFAFLEEDLDASTFIEAYKARYGTKPTFTDINCNGYSPIRDYPRFLEAKQ